MTGIPGGPDLALSMVPSCPAGGSGGRTPNGQITAKARELLKGRWGLPIAFCFLLALLQVFISIIPFVGGLAGLLLTGAFELGMVIFFLTFIRNGKAELGMMFHGFNSFGTALAAYLLIGVFVFLWSLLLIVPGIIASLAYSQAFWLIADDKNLGPLAAITKSKEMMRGHKWRLFCLGLRFFGWSLLAILTLGIGLLWVWPYAQTSMAVFYDDLRPAGLSR